MAKERVAPGGWRQTSLPLWAVARVGGRQAGTGPLHLFTTLGRHRRLAKGWLVFAACLMPGGRLPRRDTELVILRVAGLRRCAYEELHHRRLARPAGLSAAEVDAAVAGDRDAGWSPRDTVVLDAVEELHATGDLGDATWGRLSAHLSELERIELVLLAGHYEMLATTIAALRIQPER